MDKLIGWHLLFGADAQRLGNLGSASVLSLSFVTKCLPRLPIELLTIVYKNIFE